MSTATATRSAPKAAEAGIARTGSLGFAALLRFAIDLPPVWQRFLEGGQVLREALSGLAYGDQGLLVIRELFEAVRGYADVPLMEDVELIRRLRRAEPIAPEVFLGAGVALAVLAGAAGWLPGGEFLQAGGVAFGLPVLGEVKLSTALAFDAGVYLVVVGLVVALLQSLGREEVRVP